MHNCKSLSPITYWSVDKERREKNGEKQKAVAVVFPFVILILIAVPLTEAVTTLPPPTVHLPNNWQQSDSKTYPDAFSEHDPTGAGMLEYTDPTNYDVIKIYYEKAQVSSYTSQQLNEEAVYIFERDDSSATLSVDLNGTTTYAGVSAGFAKGRDDTYAIYTMELVFIKGEYYFSVYALYDDTALSQNNVDSIVNSIDVSGAAAGEPFPWLYVIIGATAAVIVIVVAVMLLVRRRKRAQQQAQYSYPPPPPPTQ
jgi:hypothetical protein